MGILNINISTLKVWSRNALHRIGFVHYYRISDSKVTDKFVPISFPVVDCHTTPY